MSYSQETVCGNEPYHDSYNVYPLQTEADVIRNIKRRLRLDIERKEVLSTILDHKIW